MDHGSGELWTQNANMEPGMGWGCSIQRLENLHADALEIPCKSAVSCWKLPVAK